MLGATNFSNFRLAGGAARAADPKPKGRWLLDENGCTRTCADPRRSIAETELLEEFAT